MFNGHQTTNTLMEKVLIKKAIGEGVDINELIQSYGEKQIIKILIDLVKSSVKTNAFYHKCYDLLKELEPKAREDYPELWI